MTTTQRRDLQLTDYDAEHWRGTYCVADVTMDDFQRPDAGEVEAHRRFRRSSPASRVALALSTSPPQRFTNMANRCVQKLPRLGWTAAYAR